MDDIDRVYYTVMGEVEEDHAVPGVGNAFSPGSECDRAYQEAYDAYARLRQRLGVTEEDGDVEVIFDSMMTICREVGRRMYRLGGGK